MTSEKLSCSPTETLGQAEQPMPARVPDQRHRDDRRTRQVALVGEQDGQQLMTATDKSSGRCLVEQFWVRVVEAVNHPYGFPPEAVQYRMRVHERM